MSEGSETARTYVGSVKIGRRKSTDATTPLNTKPEKKHRFRAMVERVIPEDPEKRDHIIKGALTLAGTTTLAKTIGAVSDLLKSPSSNAQTAQTANQPQKDIVVKEGPPDISQIRETKIDKEFQAYKDDKDRAVNTLYWKDTITAVAKDKRFGLNEEEQKFWVNRMLEIIFVESEGDEKADPAYKIRDPQLSAAARKKTAKGLTQLLPSTAAELARIYGVTNYDLLKGWDNIFLGLANQLRWAKRYGTELGAWTHHLGSGNMDQAIEAYLVSDIKIANYDRDLRLSYIEEYDIDPFRLLQSKVVIYTLGPGQLNALNDETEHYYPRLRAGGRCMKLPDFVKAQTIT